MEDKRTCELSNFIFHIVERVNVGDEVAGALVGCSGFMLGLDEGCRDG
jgi:hypothetical protein